MSYGQGMTARARASGSWCAALSGWGLIWGLGACTKGPYWPQQPYPPDRYVIKEVAIGPVEAEGTDEGSLQGGLSTARSPRFLGIWDGVAFDYEVFDENVLARDLERVERYYRARGYYQAKVTAARVIRVDRHRVRVEIRVDEGEPVRLRGVPVITGTARLPLDQNGKPTLATEVIRAVTLREGDLFDEADFQRVEQAITDGLADRGYAFVRVKSAAEVDVARHTATARYDVEPGPPARYGKITIHGLSEIPENKVRHQLLLREGRRYSKKDLQEAQETLVALGVFARVDVQPDLSHPEQGQVPIDVYVTESALRAVQVGGGVQFDMIRFSNQFRLGWEHRNLFGGMRKFTIDDRPALTYFPLSFQNLRAPTRLLPENRLHLGLEQPSFVEGRTSGFLSLAYNVFPLLYQLPQDMENPDNERIIGYHEFKTAAGVQRAFFRRRLGVRTSLNWQADFPFTYPDFPYTDELRKPAGLEPVEVVFPELVTTLDFRDHPVQTHSGLLLGVSLQVAGLGGLGNVEDLRVQPEARFFLPISRRVTLALRGTVGLLFPRNYGGTLETSREAPANDQEVIRDQHKLLFRVFYSGGPNSNRGYPFRGVGPHGTLGFLVVSSLPCPDVNARVTDATPDYCVRPLGGLSLWESTVEVRYPIWAELTGVVFLDASNLTRKPGRLDFVSPHWSCGLGARYLTPIGPIRLDIGYRLLRTLAPSDRQEMELAYEPDPGELLGLPIALQVSLFEAF